MRRSSLLIIGFSLLFLAGCSRFFSEKQPSPLSVPPPELTCDELRTQIYKEECRNLTESRILEAFYREITETFDRSRCDQLLPPERVKSCQDFIDSSGVQGPLAETDLMLFREAQTGEALEKCDAITNSSYRTYCLSFIEDMALRKKVGEIILSKDKNRCKEIKKEEYQKYCEALFTNP